MRKYCHKIATKLAMSEKEVDELLLPDSIDYGKISNWVYLVGVMHRARIIHRRDSDCFIDEKYGKMSYPIYDVKSSF